MEAVLKGECLNSFALIRKPGKNKGGLVPLGIDFGDDWLFRAVRRLVLGIPIDRSGAVIDVVFGDVAGGDDDCPRIINPGDPAGTILLRFRIIGKGGAEDNCTALDLLKKRPCKFRRRLEVVPPVLSGQFFGELDEVRFPSLGGSFRRDRGGERASGVAFRFLAGGATGGKRNGCPGGGTCSEFEKLAAGEHFLWFRPELVGGNAALRLVFAHLKRQYTS